MNPYGLVAAASTTSQTFRSMRWHSIASSFTSAMFTERKMFSSSFVSSAASHDDTGTSVLHAGAVELDRPVAAGVGEPAHDLRRGAHRVVGAAGVDPLGRHREVEVLAAAQAARLQDRQEHLARRSRVARRLEHDELAAAQVAGDLPGGAVSIARSGSRLVESGVGRQIRIASAPPRRRRTRRGGDRPRAHELGEHRRVDVLDVALAPADRLDPAPVGLDAHHRAPGAAEFDGQRQAHVASADDSDVRWHAVQMLSTGGDDSGDAAGRISRRRRAADARPGASPRRARRHRGRLELRQPVPAGRRWSRPIRSCRGASRTARECRYASFCTPPESVRQTAADIRSAVKSR